MLCLTPGLAWNMVKILLPIWGLWDEGEPEKGDEERERQRRVGAGRRREIHFPWHFIVEIFKQATKLEGSYQNTYTFTTQILPLILYFSYFITCVSTCPLSLRPSPILLNVFQKEVSTSVHFTAKYLHTRPWCLHIASFGVKFTDCETYKSEVNIHLILKGMCNPHP